MEYRRKTTTTFTTTFDEKFGRDAGKVPQDDVEVYTLI